MAELVDAAGLGPAAARFGGSSPFTRTTAAAGPGHPGRCPLRVRGGSRPVGARGVVGQAGARSPPPARPSPSGAARGTRTGAATGRREPGPGCLTRAGDTREIERPSRRPHEGQGAGPAPPRFPKPCVNHDRTRGINLNARSVILDASALGAMPRSRRRRGAVDGFGLSQDRVIETERFAPVSGRRHGRWRRGFGRVGPADPVDRMRRLSL